MKHKVSELEGPPLDAAVAKASGWTAKRVRDPDGIVEGGRPFVNYVDGSGAGQYKPEEFAPSTDWSQGGPIIERERITVSPAYRYTADDTQGVFANEWQANVGNSGAHAMWGSTPLIAAMRAYVASKLGDEVELP